MQHPGYACSRIFILCLILLLASCTKIKDLIAPPTPRELYEREFPEDDPRFTAWEEAFEQGLKDSLEMDLAYQETGHFFPDAFDVYSYNVELRQGEIFILETFTDSINARVFIDFFRQTTENDSLKSYEFIERTEPTDRNFRFEVGESTTYKIIIQPAIDVQTPFSLTAYTMPSYGFPVEGHGNSDIRSFWGATRDAGRRSHEGIDIFAPRGTPVLASVDGWVRYTGERGLGGKQVWVRTGVLGGKSLYYAHMDSIAVSSSTRVNRGDTLGFVGNTGNASTTNPHLHFGIYGRNGAVNPLPFVFERERPEQIPDIEEPEKRELVVQSPVANLRIAATLQEKIIGEARNGDRLQLLGSTNDWKHVRTQGQMKAFIHESLVE